MHVGNFKRHTTKKDSLRALLPYFEVVVLSRNDFLAVMRDLGRLIFCPRRVSILTLSASSLVRGHLEEAGNEKEAQDWTYCGALWNTTTR